MFSHSPTFLDCCVAEIASLVAILGYYSGHIPAIAATLAILWYLVNLWESKTGSGIRSWFHKPRGGDPCLQAKVKLELPNGD